MPQVLHLNVYKLCSTHSATSTAATTETTHTAELACRTSKNSKTWPPPHWFTGRIYVFKTFHNFFMGAWTQVLRESDQGGLWLPSSSQTGSLSAGLWKDLSGQGAMFTTRTFAHFLWWTPFLPHHPYNSQLAICVLILLMIIFNIQDTFFLIAFFCIVSFSYPLNGFPYEGYKQKYFLYSNLVLPWFYYVHLTIWN